MGSKSYEQLILETLEQILIELKKQNNSESISNDGVTYRTKN